MKTMEKFLGIFIGYSPEISETIRQELIRITADDYDHIPRLHHHKQVKIINQIMEEYRTWKKSN
jgi:hypothetical protein